MRPDLGRYSDNDLINELVSRKRIKRIGVDRSLSKFQLEYSRKHADEIMYVAEQSAVRDLTVALMLHENTGVIRKSQRDDADTVVLSVSLTVLVDKS